MNTSFEVSLLLHIDSVVHTLAKSGRSGGNAEKFGFTVPEIKRSFLIKILKACFM